MHLDGGMTFTLGQGSQSGLKAINEDSIGIRVPDGSALTTKGAVAVIADGVSTAEAGKEASDTCVTGFLSDYFSTPDSWSVKKSAQQVLNALNRWLYGQGQRFIQAEKGYVCTLSIAVFKSHTAHLFHVGDTRIYRFRDGALELLTRDHATPVGKGQSYLTRAMGLDVSLEVDYRTVELAEGDIFLLSSDGVHEYLSNAEIVSILGVGSDDFEGLCGQLIEKALANQSSDNLSCQLVRVDRLPLESADDIYRKLTALPFPPPLRIGAVLDGYRIDDELHASSRSQLYRVTDLASGEPRVMKTPSVNFEDDPAYIERFVMESWIGRRLDSVHIARIIDDGRPRNCLYYIAEYIDGCTLRQWLKQHPDVTPQEVVALVAQIVKGLQAMHRRETCHHDLKPENVMVTRDGVAKIVDFGSCHVSSIGEISAPIERDVVLGTAQYSAPEHRLGHKSGALADQFSLAVMVFEMLTGRLPFDGKLESAQQTAEFHRLTYVPAVRYNPHVPLWMDAALRKALSISPELRYREVSEFLHDLQHPNARFVEELRLPLAHRNPVRFWQAVAAILLLLELLTLVLMLGRG